MLSVRASRRGAVSCATQQRCVPRVSTVVFARLGSKAAVEKAGVAKKAKAAGAKAAGPKAEAAAAPRKFENPEEYRLWPTNIYMPAVYYNAVLAGELLFYAALADAAFSGDWSRIGVLTPDQEALAGTAFYVIMSAHAAVGVITAAYAARVQYPVLDAGVRGFLFGTLGLYDVYVRANDDFSRNPANN
ncbi:hypothetical protein CHLRE_16g690130v5 [Chlamydomonas reinhardtii]|uniref:DUF7887 domain-containing protein n=1 Tax=Chlamydomonas reinhardtii TaxID=3055 RepID=A8JB77_CHLRE|nr:uncharacterized protein CHLRE_16g690130v5 [Chlamydomonas reinhardtii]PNW71832.1 hypothetical protein CHLRE_16g690130v5 [Chlamydomonas reinhardtii]|eukprot:XP_001699187.1 predicted protein [Chlamydomonas reinhardtii]